MKYRTVEILDEIDPGAAGTHVIPLNLRDPVSRINIAYTCYPISEAMIAAVAANISKIELTDGSDVLFSLDGYECQALGFFDRKINALTGPNYIAGSAIRSHFPIDFGRFRFDPELALVPDKFNNLMLKITYNETLVDASVVDHSLEIYADCFDEKTISPIGYLSAKEWINFNAAAATGYKDVYLPTDEIIRRILVRSYCEKKSPEYVLGEVRLTEDEKKRVVFDWQMYKYYQEQLTNSQPIIERMFEYANAAGDYDKFAMMSDYMATYAPMGFASSDPFVDNYLEGGYITRVADATIMTGGIMVGRQPHHTWDFPMGNPEDKDDWYDVTNKGSVILRCREGGTAGTIQVFLQQMRRY